MTLQKVSYNSQEPHREANIRSIWVSITEIFNSKAHWIFNWLGSKALVIVLSGSQFSR